MNKYELGWTHGNGHIPVYEHFKTRDELNSRLYSLYKFTQEHSNPVLVWAHKWGFFTEIPYCFVQSLFDNGELINP